MTTLQTIFKNMVQHASSMSVKTLKEECIKLISKTDDDNSLVFDALLSALHNKVPSEDFCKFCEILESEIK